MTFSSFDSYLDGKVLVVRNQTTEEHKPVPLFCHLCEFPMITSDDCIAYRKLGVCSHCLGHWEFHRDCNLAEKKYPSKDSEEWKEYREIRRIRTMRLIEIR